MAETAGLLAILGGALLFVGWLSERIAAHGCGRDD